MKTNIVLIGMPGCGKTTIGEQLAEELNRPFVDADTYIVDREGRSIPDLFAEGEDCFRDAEERAVAALAKERNLVIATGGGVVKRAINLQRLHETGTILFIDRAPEDIASDVEVETRPLLKDGPSKVYALYKERIALYRGGADFIVKNEGTLADVVARIVALTEKEHI